MTETLVRFPIDTLLPPHSLVVTRLWGLVLSFVPPLHAAGQLSMVWRKEADVSLVLQVGRWLVLHRNRRDSSPGLSARGAGIFVSHLHPLLQFHQLQP